MKMFRLNFSKGKCNAVKNIAIALIVGIGATFSSLLVAENLSTSVAEQGNRSTQTPQNGQKMDNIETQYGTPIEKVMAIGEPPISRWVYSEFTVYFENETVLHAVLHRS